MSNPTTNYKISTGEDLSEIFQPLSLGTSYPTVTSYNVTGYGDLNTIFAAFSGTSIGYDTGYKVGSNDLSNIFAPYNKLWPYINFNNKNTRQSTKNGPSTKNPITSPITYTYYTTPSSSASFYKNKLVIGPTGIIYMVDYTTGDIYALNSTLTYLYKYVTSYTGYTFTPTIGLNNIMYYSSTDKITALQNIDTNASLLWNYTSSSSPPITNPNSPIIGTNQTIYVSTGNGYIFAINNNGSLKWFFEVLSNNYISNLAIGNDGTIYVTASTFLYAITDNGSNASFKWTEPFNSNYTLNSSTILNTPSIDSNGNIYIIATTSSISYIFAIIDNGPNPSQKWSLDMSTYSTLLTSYKLGTYYKIQEFPYTDDDVVFVNISISNNNNTLYVFTGTQIISIKSTDGSCNWITTANIGSTITAVSIGNDGVIYTTGDYGYVSRLTDNGLSYTLDWYSQLTGTGGTGGGYSSASSIGSNGQLYYGCAKNLIFEINQ